MNKSQQQYIYFRPHCGGYNYTITPVPTTLPELYAFNTADAKVFTCDCPEGITGDRCESCADVEGQFRYTKEPGVCADCECSDLSKNKQCAKDSGQCPCKMLADVRMGGRRCVSSIKLAYNLLQFVNRIVFTTACEKFD